MQPCVTILAVYLTITLKWKWNCEAFDLTDCFLSTPVSDTAACSTLASSFDVYTYSINDFKCVKNSYNGCSYNENTFREKEECQEVAEPICGILKPFLKESRKTYNGKHQSTADNFWP
ncbi:unnamed protein product [Acanthoscelides obtectus]|uniref:BPTI/Kunitz inhibitor domain-containing protein n=1 Tax=Acanthoscelides obtectus TaxID=200917 RepID=A0A9P0M4Z9_ACAOB|nr:unnamed protein product [Acanthoscelides obtectus]CAK1646265.1 hypothetical protein AOBTE_LOCUS14540 [Acanthoscelides obtectus]